MTDAGVFNPAARAAILEVGEGRCIGCGRPDVTTQHRRARGMGGTNNIAIGHPANGVPLCGDGVRGCHGWTESHPTAARLLGYAIAPGEDASAPFWHFLLGWRRWVEVDGCPAHAYVDEDELDRLGERRTALAVFQHARPVAPILGKPTR